MTKQLGEKQIAWLKEKFGKAFFRNPNNAFFIKISSDQGPNQPKQEEKEKTDV